MYMEHQKKVMMLKKIKNKNNRKRFGKLIPNLFYFK